MLKRCLVLACSLVLCSCASPKANYRPQSVPISEPSVGTISQRSIGETLVRQGVFTTTKAIRVMDRVSVGALGGYTIEPGYYIKSGEDKKSEFYQPEMSTEGGRISASALADPPSSVEVVKDKNKLCAVSVFNFHYCKDDAPFEKVERHFAGSNSFQQTLIYSGRIGDKLKIGYREFSNNAARPAFNNEVEYDLSQSNIIAYKGARLEVVEATNEYIKYRLISNFEMGM